MVAADPHERYRHLIEAMQSLDEKIQERYPGTCYSIMAWAKRNAPALRLAVLRGLDEIDELMKMDIEISHLQSKLASWSLNCEKLYEVHYQSLCAHKRRLREE